METLLRWAVIGGIVIAAAIVLVAAVVMIANRNTLRVKYQGAVIAFPKAVKTREDGKRGWISINIPESFAENTMENFPKLAEKLSDAVDREKYYDGYLEQLWILILIASMINAERRREVSVSGYGIAETARDLLIEWTAIIFSVALVVAAEMGEVKPFAIPDGEKLNEVLMKSGAPVMGLIQSGKRPNVSEYVVLAIGPERMANALNSNFQSCGEGGCCGRLSGYSPYPVEGGQYYPYRPDGGDEGVSVDGHAFMGAGLSARSTGEGWFRGRSAHRERLPEPHVVSTISRYYADKPKITRSFYSSGREMNQDGRPTPYRMSNWAFGPYAENRTYIRPSQSRFAVMETQ